MISFTNCAGASVFNNTTQLVAVVHIPNILSGFSSVKCVQQFWGRKGGNISEQLRACPLLCFILIGGIAPPPIGKWKSLFLEKVYSLSLESSTLTCFWREKISAQNGIGLVNELLLLCWCQAAFGDAALFFYDVYGGNYVGVVWKPLALDTLKHIQVGLIQGIYVR